MYKKKNVLMFTLLHFCVFTIKYFKLKTKRNVVYPAHVEKRDNSYFIKQSNSN